MSGQAQQIFFFFGAFDTSHAVAAAVVVAVAVAWFKEEDGEAATPCVTVVVAAVAVPWFKGEEEAATPFCTCAAPIKSSLLTTVKLTSK